TPFDPHQYVEKGDITEGTNWQYSWYVPHDVPGLISLFGSKDAFTKKLDSLFISKGQGNFQEPGDIQGNIGEYWHGNEPSHHIIFLYDYAGQPWKTQQRVHQIMTTQYGNKPNSLCGNDDCGQMSAWYIFNALGFYPVAPASSQYAIGSPALKRAMLKLSNGRTFTITAEKLSPVNIYIQSATINGRKLMSPFLSVSDVLKGGTLKFVMGPAPNEAWGNQ
ncbi:MAG TPA: glycoside hydrolase domain-containing protein, partial [Bacteroidota bacterium]|nr:glycoside hydrolase domain-containing protein [Bacteroidota bacterium]